MPAMVLLYSTVLFCVATSELACFPVAITYLTSRGSPRREIMSTERSPPIAGKALLKAWSFSQNSTLGQPKSEKDADMAYNTFFMPSASGRARIAMSAVTLAFPSLTPTTT